MPPDLRSKVTQKGTKIAHLGLGDKEKAESVNSIPSAFDFLRDKAGLEGRDTGKVLQALIHVGELPKETLRLVARDAIRAAAFLIISNVKKMEEEEAMEERIIGRIAAETAAPLEKLAASLKDTSDNLKEVRASVEALEKQQEKVVGASAPGNGTSYAAKAAAGIGRSQMVSGQQAQDLQRQRRIMVMWPEEDMGGKSTKSLTEKELVLKANMALKGYRRDVPKMPEGVRFVSAKKLPSGKGFQLNLATVEHADWLRKNDTLQGFLRHFDGGLCTSRPQTFGGVAEYVPISFSPDDRAALAEAAADSQMDSEDLVSARWIKPVQRRRPEQTTAFLIINFASPGAAQFAFAHGMIIEGKQVQVRELEPEPRRCLKCQKHEPGHMARDCPLKEDVCGTCGENHRTADCDVTEQEDFWCNNCQVRGHAAWDRQCPVFLLKKQQRTERLQSANQGIPIPRPNAAARREHRDEIQMSPDFENSDIADTGFVQSDDDPEAESEGPETDFQLVAPSSRRKGSQGRKGSAGVPQPSVDSGRKLVGKGKGDKRKMGQVPGQSSLKSYNFVVDTRVDQESRDSAAEVEDSISHNL